MFPIVYINAVWFQFLHRINAAFGVSNKFVPYRPNYDLVCSNINTLYGVYPKGRVESGSLNDITSTVFSLYTSAVSDRPTSDGMWYYVRTSNLGTGHAFQEAFAMSSSIAYVRVQYQGTWNAWKQITNA